MRTLLVALCFILFGGAGRASADTKRERLLVDECPAKSEVPGESEKERRSRRTREAGDAYDRGLVLYEEGDYEGAVSAFVDSYCRKAHPAAFYNIAQSYERLLEFELSVQYFERYVEDAGASAPNARKAALRAEVLRNLPAQVRVASVPPGAAVTVHSASGLIARGTANADAPLEVQQGEYTMHVEMPGYESVDKPLVTKPGKPYSFYISLKAKKGQLQVTASPNNGRIFLDDRLVGVGVYKASLPVGPHEITVEAPNRAPSTQIVQLNAGELTESRIELERPPDSGRRTLLVASTLGLGLSGGVAVSEIFGQGTTLTAVGSLATTALGFGGAYYGIPERTTRGDAWYIITSSLLGFAEGTLVGSFFACEVVDSQSSTQEEDCSATAIIGSGLSGSLAGVITAALTHRQLELTTGDAALLGSGAFWGLSSGAFLYAVFDSDLRTRDAMLFAGLNLGLVTSAGLMAQSEVSLRRVAIIDLAGVGGVLGGASLGQAFGSSDEQLRHFSILGMVTGLVAGTFLTRYMDEVTTSTLPEDEQEGAQSSRLRPIATIVQDLRGQSVLSFGLSQFF